MKVALGCRSLDELLGGGIEDGCITLLHGEAGSGKTNFCLQLARNVVRAGRKVIFIDTEGVSMERLRQICGEDFDLVAKNILFSEPYNFEEQESLIEKAVKIAESNADVGLIVIDSITMHYRLTMRDETRRDERYSLTRQIARLLKVSRTRGIPVVVTSQEVKPMTRAKEFTWGRVIVTMHIGAEGAAARHTPDRVERFAGENRGNSVAFARVAVAGAPNQEAMLNLLSKANSVA